MNLDLCLLRQKVVIDGEERLIKTLNKSLITAVIILLCQVDSFHVLLGSRKAFFSIEAFLVDPT